MNLNQIWQAALGTIQLQTSRQEFDTWLRGTTLLALDGGMATVGTTSPFHKEGLENRYLAPVRRSLGDVVGYPVQVRVVIGAGAAVRSDTNGNGHAHGNGSTPLMAHADADSLANAERAVQLDFSNAMRAGMLNPKYTFARFIVGSSNRLAHAACLGVADNPGQAYNPLFLYGGVGLGKTHLLHAIGNYVLDRDPEINVLYVSSEKFTNDLINAIRRQQTEEFRMRYRNIDVLLIDDIQFIAGKDATQEEFFHTFNALHAAAKHIIISSDKPPKAILTLEERLRSRFEWGLICDIQPPDLETRTAILRTKGEQMNVYVPDEVIDFLAHKVQSNIRELEGSLNRVAAYADLHQVHITVEVATLALADLLGSARRKRITPDMILNAVSEHYGVDLRTLQGRGRSRNIVVPRHVVMYLLREETDCSLMDIGNLLGGRDHTTVMHGCEKIGEEINTDTRLRNEVLSIRERLHAQVV
ncbi:chromosomal replication initiator protein DnaA [Candidatus Viridilinea mediisalina]|uniref:Chromosomal replication initiator protein DnaA n=1 Tax=Candidatus Viridilinea mediisalina TaxID=2024553 RepID=A0A2A6RPS9_9CHLR|nr:chromosomal replication initiator protein DnaA [Candidatus Viridilinea mediisalina]PDW04878.1 chromosomal replication initiation protein DnaA [Candidatus Viridilinea mediisalina]